MHVPGPTCQTDEYIGAPTSKQLIMQLIHLAKMQSSILAGVRVVDWTTMAAGPGATAMLSELGANVDKIEAPQGDPWRSVGVERERGVSCVFEFDNRGKRSVVLDLSTAAGQLALKMLLRRADVFVTNVRPESARRLGLAIVGTALAGLVLITIFWLEQHLGLASPTRAPPGINIQLQNEIGGWLALGGHTCALISGTLAAILGSTWD